MDYFYLAAGAFGCATATTRGACAARSGPLPRSWGSRSSSRRESLQAAQELFGFVVGALGVGVGAHGVVLVGR